VEASLEARKQTYTDRSVAWLGDGSLNVIIATFSVSLIRGTHVADNLRRLGVRDRERAAERLSSTPAGYYPTANAILP
jgi:hypothetical protein